MTKPLVIKAIAYRCADRGIALAMQDDRVIWGFCVSPEAAQELADSLAELGVLPAQEKLEPLIGADFRKWLNRALVDCVAKEVRKYVETMTAEGEP